MPCEKISSIDLSHSVSFISYLKQSGVKELLNAEEKYLENLQQAPSRFHNALRNVGNFPFIITTNMDELLERFLWKTGNGGEKIRLDQVSCTWCCRVLIERFSLDCRKGLVLVLVLVLLRPLVG